METFLYVLRASLADLSRSSSSKAVSLLDRLEMRLEISELLLLLDVTDEAVSFAMLEIFQTSSGLNQKSVFLFEHEVILISLLLVEDSLPLQ